MGRRGVASGGGLGGVWLVKDGGKEGGKLGGGVWLVKEGGKLGGGVWLVKEGGKPVHLPVLTQPNGSQVLTHTYQAIFILRV